MAGRLTLRDATIDDAALLRTWDDKPHLEGTGDDDWQWQTELLRKPPWRQSLISEVNGKPIGFIQIIDPALEDSHYWGKVENNLRAIDIWIGEESFLGKGYGTEMMQRALDRCFAEPLVQAVLVDPLASNLPAHRFYEKQGFRIVERRFFGKDDCLVFRISRHQWQNPLINA